MNGSEHTQIINLIKSADIEGCDMNQLVTIINLFDVLNIPMKDHSTAKSNFKEMGRMMSSEEIEKLADVFSFIALCVWVLTLHIKLDRLNGKLENK